jgi:gamma-glutamyltranspeptidase/glutathione hydrolase
MLEGFPVSNWLLITWKVPYLDIRKFQTLKKPIQVMEKYPVRAIYSGIHFSRNVKNCKRGRDEFYKERTISGFIKEQGGFLSYEDLANHSEWVDPVSTNYRGYDVNFHQMGRDAALNIIEGYDFSDIPFGSAKHTLSTKLKNWF